MTEHALEAQPFIWCLIANMRAERHAGPGGTEVWAGTKHFRPGAKLYCWPPMWDSYNGTGTFDSIRVFGMHRASHRYVTMVVKARWLTNWRVKAVYDPRIIRALTPSDRPLWNDSDEARARAEELAERMCRFYPDVSEPKGS